MGCLLIGRSLGEDAQWVPLAALSEKWCQSLNLTSVHDSAGVQLDSSLGQHITNAIRLSSTLVK